MRELQVAHGLTLQRLDALDALAAGGASAATTAAAGAGLQGSGDGTPGLAAGSGQGADSSGGNVLALAGGLHRLQVRACASLCGGTGMCGGHLSMEARREGCNLQLSCHVNSPHAAAMLGRAS